MEITDEVFRAAVRAYHAHGRIDDEGDFEEALHDAVTAGVEVYADGHATSVTLERIDGDGTTDQPLVPNHAGVVLTLDPDSNNEVLALVDVASSVVLARREGGAWWIAGGDPAPYQRLYVQGL